MEICKNCGTEITETNLAFPQDAVDLINLAANQTAGGYCLKCAHKSKEYYLRAYEWMTNKKDVIKNRIYPLLDSLPTITTIPPANWDFQIIGAANARYLGAQLFFSSDDKVVKTGLIDCMVTLYGLALERGGNVIVGLDYDFFEINNSVGFDKSVIVATGTIVNLRNPTNVLGNEQSTALNKLSEIGKELSEWTRFKDYRQYCK